MSCVACDANNNDPTVVPDATTSTKPTQPDENTKVEAELEIEYEKYLSFNWHMKEDSEYLGYVKQVVQTQDSMQTGFYDGNKIHFNRKKWTLEIGQHEQIILFANEVVITKDKDVYTLHLFKKQNDAGYNMIDEKILDVNGDVIGAYLKDGSISIVYKYENKFFVRQINMLDLSDLGAYEILVVVDDKQIPIVDIDTYIQGLIITTSDETFVFTSGTEFEFVNNSAVVNATNPMKNHHIEQILCHADTIQPAFLVKIKNEDNHIYYIGAANNSKPQSWIESAHKIKLIDGYTTDDVVHIEAKYATIIIKLKDGTYLHVSKHELTNGSDLVVEAKEFANLRKYENQLISVMHDGVQIVALFSDGHTYKLPV